MSITRIAFNDSANYSGAFYVSINPVNLQLNQSDLYSKASPLDGSTVKQTAYFDNRSQVLKWNPIRSDFTGLTAMIATLQSYKDSTKYVNFGTADYAVPTLGWTQVRIQDVKVNVSDGGRLKYSIEMILDLV